MVMELQKYGEIWQAEGVVASSLGIKRLCSFHFAHSECPLLESSHLESSFTCVKLRHIYRMTKATWRETQRSSVMFWR